MPPTRAPRESKTSRRRIEAAEKRARALELRKAGASFDQIAQQVGYGSRGRAYEAVMQGLAEVTLEPAEELLKVELQRLDAMQVGLWGKARVGDVQAVAAVLKVMERRAKLLGLDNVEARLAAVAEQELELQQRQAYAVAVALSAVMDLLSVDPGRREEVQAVFTDRLRQQVREEPPQQIGELREGDA